MNDEQQLRIEDMKLAAQLIRDYKLKDNYFYWFKNSVWTVTRCRRKSN